MKYVKKPIEIEAFRLGYDAEPQWFKDIDIDEQILPPEYDYTVFLISTLEGERIAHKGDMIIKGIQGEIYPCKKDIFDATYDLVEDTPQFKSLLSKFQQEQICWIIGQWYLGWKSSICDYDTKTHYLGFAKEQLKILICEMKENPQGGHSHVPCSDSE